MKKILAIVALLSCAATAYGTVPTWKFPQGDGTFAMGANTNGTMGTIAFKPSANVAMGYDASTSTGVSYVVGAIHGQGSRIYGTSSVDTNIFYQDTTAPGLPASVGATMTYPSTITAFPGSNTSATTPTTYFSTGWTASK